MRDDGYTEGPAPAYHVVILTLDSHAAGPCMRAAQRLSSEFPGLSITVHAAAEWGERPEALTEARADIARGDIILTTLLFLEEHIKAVLPDLQARRDTCDAMAGIIADGQIVRLTRMGTLDMSAPDSRLSKLLKKLRGGGGKGKSGVEDGARKMRMLRRLPRILKLIPGKAQDLRAWFLTMQYWLGASDDNVESLIRFLISRYCRHPEWRGTGAPAPLEYPDTGLYHPDLPDRITTDPADIPGPMGAKATVGLLMMRSYVLSGDTAHYDGAIRALEARGLRVLPAFAGGLDARPAMEAFFHGPEGTRIDTLLSLTGFSLVGGPAYNDNASAIAWLKRLDVPYVAAHPLEFQTLGQWAVSPQGLGPIETTMLIALPELDGATNPTVFAGRHGEAGCDGCAHACRPTSTVKAMAPCLERLEALARRIERLAALRRSQVADRRVGIVLFGFPPNAGAAGTAAYLDVFRSLYNTLHAMADRGYDLTPPDSVEALREAVLHGTASRYGQEANVAAHVSADQIVTDTPWLSEIEAQWGAAPGKVQSDGRGVFVLGAQFGKVFVGLQPAFGFEGDPMRLLFEGSFAPTHAFVQFYLWLRNSFKADALLHFGMHGALEFMPGKQTGPSTDCWPDRLISDMPNIYLYASNNPSEATLAKRRTGAITVSHLTPPLATAGLYKGLTELKDSLTRWRGAAPDAPERDELAQLIAEQAANVDMEGHDPQALWLRLLETEDALIPEGLHVVGAALSQEARENYLSLLPQDAPRDAIEKILSQDNELPALLKALDAGYTAPVPGGDLIRSPDILPTGRNIHAFDPFRMPSAFACRAGAKQAQVLLDTHRALPRTVAVVLWGSDNIKSDGEPLAQALSLMGATPRFDAFGRLCGADLIPLAELNRPRIDVIMTLSGIFRDLLPLQTKLLAEAALKAAEADEPEEMNFIRAHALATMAETGCDLATAAVRVFSNAEGAYGSNVNQLVDSSAYDDEDELADAYEARKSFGYGVDGKAHPRHAQLQRALKTVDLAYQNLESIELGVTTVDHYFDTLGGISRAVKRARGGTDAAVYISDTTLGTGKVRKLADQVALETRARTLNPKFHEALLRHGAEGVRQIESHLTNTMGWSATTGQVDPWVYQRLSETFVLDETMRQRLADLNPAASSRMANRLLEAHDRAYWQTSEETLAVLRDAADALEDRLEGVAAE